MTDIVVEKIDKVVNTYQTPKQNIVSSSSTNVLNVTTINGFSDNISLEKVTTSLTIEPVEVGSVIVASSINTISVNCGFSMDAIEIFIKDIIATNPSLISGSNASVKIEHLLINIENGKYYVNTTSDIEGELITMLVDIGDEQLEVTGNINIVNKRKVEIQSDINIQNKYARVTYIKKV